MKKALPLALLLYAVFSLLSTTSTFANDGSTRLAPHNRPFEPAAVAPAGGQSQGFWGSLWDDILGFFGHHDHHAAPGTPGAPGGSGSGSGSGSNAPGAGGSTPSAPGGTAGAGSAGSPSVPVNGGLVLLLAAGLSFGIIKASKYKVAPQR